MIELFRRNKNDRAGQDVDNFSKYKIRIFKAVQPNMALICQNIFTGKPFVRTSGLVILMPWVKSKMVSLARNTIDYPKEKYRTSDGIEVTVDLAIVFSILDPIKYEFNNNDPMQELKIKTQDKLRQYVASKTADEMITETHTLATFDLNRDYELFTEETGLKINDVSFKKVELPQSMRDDYEKQKVQERENARLLAEAQARREASIIEAETRCEVAKYDSEANKILGEISNKITADELKQIIDSINELNISPALKLELLKAQVLSKGKANVFYNMGEGQVDFAKYLMAKEENSVVGPSVQRTRSLPPKYVDKY